MFLWVVHNEPPHFAAYDLEGCRNRTDSKVVMEERTTRAPDLHLVESQQRSGKYGFDLDSSTLVPGVEWSSLGTANRVLTVLSNEERDAFLVLMLNAPTANLALDWLMRTEVEI